MARFLLLASYPSPRLPCSFQRNAELLCGTWVGGGLGTAEDLRDDEREQDKEREREREREREEEREGEGEREMTWNPLPSVPIEKWFFLKERRFSGFKLV